MNPETIAALIGAIVGAGITAGVQWITSERGFRHQLRMAAIEKRLAAHQKAYSLWRELKHNAHDSKTIGDVVLRCQDWWEKNCLYLEPEAREAFFKAYIAAHSHHQYVELRDNPDLVKNNWKTIIDAGTIIEKCVDLPPIAGEDKRINLKSDA
jgi:hypothetical protein